MQPKVCLSTRSNGPSGSWTSEDPSERMRESIPSSAATSTNQPRVLTSSSTNDRIVRWRRGNIYNAMSHRIQGSRFASGFHKLP